MSTSNVWESAYVQTIGNTKGYAARLRELLTWDKPTNEKKNDPLGLWVTWAKKCAALDALIKETHPRTVITLDNKIVLKK